MGPLSSDEDIPPLAVRLQKKITVHKNRCSNLIVKVPETVVKNCRTPITKGITKRSLCSSSRRIKRIKESFSPDNKSSPISSTNANTSIDLFPTPSYKESKTITNYKLESPSINKQITNVASNLNEIHNVSFLLSPFPIMIVSDDGEELAKEKHELENKKESLSPISLDSESEDEIPSIFRKATDKSEKIIDKHNCKYLYNDNIGIDINNHTKCILKCESELHYQSSEILPIAQDDPLESEYDTEPYVKPSESTIKKNKAKRLTKKRSLPKPHTLSDSEHEQSYADVAEILAFTKQKKKALSPDPNQPPEMQKITKKMLKEEEKNRKKIMKNLIQLKNAQLKGDLQYLSVELDADLQTHSFFQDVIDVLNANQIKHNFRNDNPSPFSIRWQREIITNLTDDPCNAAITSVIEQHVFIIIPTSKLIPLVSTFKSDPCSTEPLEVLQEFHSLQQELNPNAQLWYFVVGLKTHFKRVKQRQKKAGVNESDLITDVIIDEALLTFKYDLDISLSSFDTMEEFGNYLAFATKSIAQAQYKKEKRNMVPWFAPGDSEGMIKVDKEGKGALKLWKQQLLQFSNVGKEVADAIISKYPSPRLLLEAYNNCTSEKEAINLLKSITISRGIGSAATIRCIGPKLSFKLYKLLSGTDPNFLLK